MKSEVNIEANMLTWAISRAGYELREFTEKMPKVGDWISGVKKPTLKTTGEFC